jgi:peptide/nickel transport system substrate-binding protein
VLEKPGMTVGYIALNTQKPPLNDVRVRRAINHAINKNAIVEKLYNGLAVVAKNPIPPTIWGYNDAIVDYEYNPEKARALLKEALPRGTRELTLYALPAPRPYFLNPSQIALAVQSDLQAVGLSVRIETFEFGTYLEKVKNGDHDLAMLGWIADYADPDNFLYFNLDKDNAKPPAGNIAFYKSDPLHEILVAAQKEADHEKRVALYRRAQEIIHADAPWVPVAHAQNVVVTRANVQGLVLHPTSWRHLWRVRLAPPSS